MQYRSLSTACVKSTMFVALLLFAAGAQAQTQAPRSPEQYLQLLQASFENANLMNLPELAKSFRFTTGKTTHYQDVQNTTYTFIDPARDSELSREQGSFSFYRTGTFKERSTEIRRFQVLLDLFIDGERVCVNQSAALAVFPTAESTMVYDSPDSAYQISHVANGAVDRTVDLHFDYASTCLKDVRLTQYEGPVRASH